MARFVTGRWAILVFVRKASSNNLLSLGGIAVMNMIRSLSYCKIFSVAFSCSFLLSQSLTAEGSNNTAAHDAHLHGYAELTIALDSDLLEINFDSPAFNIVGFEHQPKSSKEIQRVRESQALLNSAERIFSFKGTNCNLKNSEVNIENIAEPQINSRKTEHDGHKGHPEEYHAHEAHAEKDHLENDGHEKHAQESHAENNTHENHAEHDGHESNNEHEEYHSEISSSYVYECDAGEKLTVIGVSFIRHFPNLEKVKVMWVTNERQGAVDLTENAKIVVLR